MPIFRRLSTTVYPPLLRRLFFDDAYSSLVSRLASGVRPFASPAMDSDEEEEQMFIELMREEMAAADQDEEHMMILGCLSSLYAGVAIGRRGGSAPGRQKCKPRQRIRDSTMHQQLQDDLVEHIWTLRRQCRRQLVCLY
ncbi:hypothetical protein QYE76_024901 [Lolium multiflorum]|uniref:Uncharacterized protein n=1 Tax=Lolium multiflorum TaxID=4521 RepID=A0AAD8VU34_LOLMU|nr:hypothetical protein QYE76_024901 [Lolium multiflorum]